MFARSDNDALHFGTVDYVQYAIATAEAERLTKGDGEHAGYWSERFQVQQLTFHQHNQARSENRPRCGSSPDGRNRRCDPKGSVEAQREKT
jgi:hypothetical protein